MIPIIPIIPIKWTELKDRITLSAEGTILVFGDRDIMIISKKKPIVLKLFSNVKLLSRSKSHIIFEKEVPDLKWPQLLDDETDVQNVVVKWDWELWYKTI